MNAQEVTRVIEEVLDDPFLVEYFKPELKKIAKMVRPKNACALEQTSFCNDCNRHLANRSRR